MPVFVRWSKLHQFQGFECGYLLDGYFSAYHSVLKSNVDLMKEPHWVHMNINDSASSLGSTSLSLTHTHTHAHQYLPHGKHSVHVKNDSYFIKQPSLSSSLPKSCGPLSFSPFILPISTIAFSKLFSSSHCKQHSDDMVVFLLPSLFPRWSLCQESTLLSSVRRSESGTWKRGESCEQRRREKGETMNPHTWTFSFLAKSFLS